MKISDILDKEETISQGYFSFICDFILFDWCLGFCFLHHEWDAWLNFIFCSIFKFCKIKLLLFSDNLLSFQKTISSFQIFSFHRHG